MKFNSLSICVPAAMASLFLLAGTEGSRGNSAPQPLTVASQINSPDFQNVSWEEAKVEKLRHAYYLLKNAKADYHGHREAAMKHIRKAAEVLGVKLEGWKEHPGESQWESDKRVREALNILTELKAEDKAVEQPHIHRAVEELNKALAVK